MKECFPNHAYLISWKQNVVETIMCGFATIRAYIDKEPDLDLEYQWSCDLATIFTPDERIEVWDSTGKKIENRHSGIFYIKDPFIDWPRRPSSIIRRESDAKAGEMFYNPGIYSSGKVLSRYRKQRLIAPRVLILSKERKCLVESFVVFNTCSLVQDLVEMFGVCIDSRVKRVAQGSIQSP